jgi:peptidoglycan/LPS O-acetylase OafA/YrhL
VVLCHLVTTALAAHGSPGELWVLEYTPLHIFWAGHQAVVFFFVLSGFVLALPFYSRPVSYRAFVVKRVLRIYAPYWAALLVALFAHHWFGRQRLSGSSTWLNSWWIDPISYRLLFDHFLLIGSFDNNALDGVIWSLVHEMRISLVFPLLIAFLLRHRWRTTLLAAAALAVLGAAINSGSSWLGHENDYGQTCAYVLMFVVGALLCRHRAAIIARSRDLPALTRWACLALAILAYTYPFWALSKVHLLHLSLIDDWTATVGVAAFIVLALSSGPAGRVLRSAPLSWLGSVSYSLYLFHAIVLVALLKLLFGVIPLWSIWMLTIVMALTFAGAGHRLLELPSIALGRRLSELVSRGRQVRVLRPTVLRDPER